LGASLGQEVDMADDRARAAPSVSELLEHAPDRRWRVREGLSPALARAVRDNGRRALSSALARAMRPPSAARSAWLMPPGSRGSSTASWLGLAKAEDFRSLGQHPGEAGARAG
jgi:hypothetical protein